MQVVTFYIECVPKPRMTRSDKWNKRPCVVRYWDFKDNLKLFALRQKFDWTNGMSVTFVMAMPDSWSKKKKEAMDGQPHLPRPDMDNLLKACQDALLEEDSSIWWYRGLKKVWGYTGKIIAEINK